MIDVIIFIVSAGPNVLKENLIETVHSLSKNIGDINYKYYIVTDSREQEKFTNEVIFAHPRLKDVIKPDALLEVVYSTKSWAIEYNAFFKKYGDTTKYILYSHDDLVMYTPDFFSKTLEKLKDKEQPIGWITYTNNFYYKHLQKPIANSCKDPFALDRHKAPCLYECHSFNMGETVTPEKAKLLNYPTRPVNIHSPFPHLCLVSAAAMKKIGPCAEWTEYTILIDNDWGLEALRQNLFNVWIPDIIYTHPNPKYNQMRKPGTDLRFEGIAHQKFYEKWGFYLPRGQQLID